MPALFGGRVLTSEPRLRRLIDAAAIFADLPGWRGLTGPEVLEGLVITESSGRANAVRYEPHQDRAGRTDQRSDGDRPGIDDGNREDDRSYGLCQVMGFNIRRIVGAPPGTPLDFSFSLEPPVNLWLGLRVLTSEIRAVQNEIHLSAPDDEVVSRALARYNGGPTGDDPDQRNGGDYRLRKYVERVHSNAILARRDRVARNWSC